jgi:hypothetical protein
MRQGGEGKSRHQQLAIPWGVFPFFIGVMSNRQWLDMAGRPVP